MDAQRLGSQVDPAGHVRQVVVDARAADARGHLQQDRPYTTDQPQFRVRGAFGDAEGMVRADHFRLGCGAHVRGQLGGRRTVVSSK
ncbi:hypothetical protein OHU45_02370 [Streptomyces tubercidicus]|uniref:hypothetical protein n=1 Tax=Streptomyces tubercidicus TaxID=47759 RepID=UPI002E1224CB|nr:hypothetical protein OG761_02195 [Streptomyces tubercidicus]WSX24613.1 hypothetical protein OG690_35640 [Streptomyces tubercidicus]